MKMRGIIAWDIDTPDPIVLGKLIKLGESLSEQLQGQEGVTRQGFGMHERREGSEFDMPRARLAFVKDENEMVFQRAAE